MIFKKELLFLVLVLASTSGQAFDWLLNPSITTTQRYTDNLRMQTGPTRSNEITTISPALNFGYIDDDNDLTGKLSLNQIEYLDESSLDFTEKIATLNHVFRRERWNTQLNFRYGEESSLGSQLGANGSGNLLVQVPRFTTTVSPSVTYMLTPRNSLQLSGSYMDVKYGSLPFNSGLGFSNYTNEQVNGIFTHNYTENLSLNLNLGYTIYKAGGDFAGLIDALNLSGAVQPYNGVTNFSQDTKSQTYQVGFKYVYDEKTTATGNVGLRDSNAHSVESITANGVSSCIGFNGIGFVNFAGTPYCPNSYSNISSSISGKIYSATLNRAFEQGNVALSFNQQLSPSSTGNQQLTTQYSGNTSYNLSDRWSTAFQGSYLESQFSSSGLSSLSLYNNRTVISFTPSIKWLWTPETYFNLSYTYVEQSFNSSSTAASQDSLQLQFYYQPQINRQVK